MLFPAWPSREVLARAVGRTCPGGVGAEVGVHTGFFSEIILRAMPIALLYSIDPWVEDYERDDAENVACHLHAVQKLGKFGARSEILRMTSARAARRFPPGSLDFVYIDADHRYPMIRNDLNLWWPKIKPGGWLWGHDYHIVDHVVPAVQEFRITRRVPIAWTIPDIYPSWHMRKP